MADFRTLLMMHQQLLSEMKITESQQDALVAYLEDLWVKNQDLNLFSRKMTPQALVVDHLLDCLIALPHLPVVETMADLGSGGGFPAIPLAITRPHIRILLYEKSPLKRRFLNEQCEHYQNLVVMNRLDMDGMDSSVQLVTARAFKPIAVIKNLTAAFFQRGGKYMLYKARAAKIQQEIKDAGIRRNQVRIQKLDPVGDAEERHLVFLGF